MHPHTFTFGYPVYIFFSEAELVLFLTGPEGTFLPIFTDRDTADQFLEGRPLDGWTSRPVTNVAVLLHILRSVAGNGVEFVAFDPVSVGPRKAISFPISQAIDSLADAERALPCDLPTLLARVRLDPEYDANWYALSDWLKDNGKDDEAVAVRMFYPAIRDSMGGAGMALESAMNLVARHATKLARLAKTIEQQSITEEDP